MAKRELIGVVKSAKMDKTVVVIVERLRKHPRYKKYIRQRTKLYAHDEKNVCKENDKVVIAPTRPLSKLKRWRVVRKLES
ncbi:30S ribosomal protein S17 [candidate division WOR-3 bacterium]|uniref:Small ribosomal subunit protein uS17 n=1 Tax=candidate division WOR-3 bacterium TaxID=2052148 RepID=A0A660SCC4_UNCW3|nr:MAG: 30S ribosomal protein S17 [candidate division WOR-3 bacterium]